MGAISNSFEKIGGAQSRVDFRAVSDAAASSLDLILSRVLPNGYWSGDEYVARNPTRNDARLGSFKVNKSGVWCDFAVDQKGGDAIDLLAYLNGTSKLDAALELASLLNVSSVGSTQLTGNVRPLPVKKASIAMPPCDATTAPTALPLRTTPDAEGKPRFMKVGNEGPRVRDGEKRRHVYTQGSVPVRIKIIKTGGDAMNIYRVSDADGSTGWQYRKPDGFEPTPYVNDQSVFDAQQIFWTEGEKDTETLANLGLPAFTFGGTGDGLPDGCAAYLTGKHVVILADNDEAGRKHAEDKAAVIHGVAASVRIVHFPELVEKGDVSDWIAAGNTADDLKRRAEETAEWSPPENDEQPDDAALPTPGIDSKTPKDQRYELPFGYHFRGDGLFWSDPSDDDKAPIKLSDCFDVLAETRDGDSSNWGVLLHWVDHDGREHRFALPRMMLAGDGSDARRALLGDGLYVAPSQKARSLFNAFLLQVRSPVRARSTQRIGWIGPAFVLPDDSFGGSDNDRLLLQTATAHEHTFRQSGTLESWQQNVARHAVGNSRLVLALSAAFAGPLIGPCAAEGGGLHIRGPSSIGKSTALHVAGSVWGGGRVTGFVRSWRATSNGLEGVAQGHCDTLLCLDELSQLAAKESGEAAYMLANGQGKARSARDGSARRASSWRVLFLSSGEIGLADKIAEDGRGRKVAAGQQVRVIDVAADAGAGMGMFENLHGFASAEALARHLREATQQHYGVAARAYLAAIVPQMSELQKHVQNITEDFCKAYVPDGADGQVHRVAQRLALIASGGELAALVGILPWPRGEATAAAGRIFESWVAARGGHAPAEERAGIEQVAAFLLANGQARFIPAWDEDTDKRIPIRDVAGYRRKSDDGWEYFITPPGWKEICTGLDPRRVAALMHGRGFLGGADGANLAKVMRIPGIGQQRVYSVTASFLEGAHD